MPAILINPVAILSPYFFVKIFVHVLEVEIVDVAMTFFSGDGAGVGESFVSEN